MKSTLAFALVALASVDAQSCPWLTQNAGWNTLQCTDGSSCNVNTHPDRWACCRFRGGRNLCPAEKPVMCEQKACGGDHCCDARQTNGGNACKLRGGERKCGASPGDCPWKFAHNGPSNEVQCMEKTPWGSYYTCNFNFDGANCCQRHGGRRRCPTNLPVMCASQSCSGDHCCSPNRSRCNNHGGVRGCSGPAKVGLRRLDVTERLAALVQTI